MIISGTGIPASPSTKVKDALFLAVYFMERCLLFLAVSTRPAGCLTSLTLGTELIGVIEIVSIKFVVCLKLPKTD